MARRVYFHIGLPKTGTTYLQSIMWNNRERLRDAGVLLPGQERREHLWASLVVRGDQRVGARHVRAPDSWDRLRAETATWRGDAIISHEFFASASADQAAAAIEALAPAQVHLVLTAREALRLFTASWQESIKNKGTVRIGDYGRSVSDDPLVVWDWRALDLGLVLDRWTGTVPPKHVHVIPLPKPGGPRELLWERFAGLIGVDPGAFDLSASFGNESMGVAETETLRRVNAQLKGFDAAVDRGVWIRSFLADERLAPRGGERYWPGQDQIDDCRRRARAAVGLVERRGFDVIGDLDDLLIPEELPERRHPDSVTEEEVAQVAVDTVALMLNDVRRLRRQNKALEARVAELSQQETGESGLVARVGRKLGALRSVLNTRARRSDG